MLTDDNELSRSDYLGDGLRDDLGDNSSDDLSILECGEMTWLEHVPLSPDVEFERRKLSDASMERWLQSLRRDCGI